MHHGLLERAARRSRPCPPCGGRCAAACWRRSTTSTPSWRRKRSAAGTKPHGCRSASASTPANASSAIWAREYRFDYSALGDAVNLASRLESETKNYDVPLLLGEQTARLVAAKYCVVELDRIRVKGKSQETHIFTVVPETASGDARAPPDAARRSLWRQTAACGRAVCRACREIADAGGLLRQAEEAHES